MCSRTCSSQLPTREGNSERNHRRIEKWRRGARQPEKLTTLPSRSQAGCQLLLDLTARLSYTTAAVSQLSQDEWKTSAVIGPVLSHFRLSVIPWIAAHQAPLSMGFSRQEYWSGLPFPPPGDLPDPGMEPRPPVAPAL